MEAPEVMALMKEGKLKTWQLRVFNKYMKHTIGTTVIANNKLVAEKAAEIEVIPWNNFQATIDKETINYKYKNVDEVLCKMLTDKKYFADYSNIKDIEIVIGGDYG